MGTTYEERRGTLYNDRITFFGNVMAFGLHVLFFFLFWRLDITILALSNFASVLYYSLSFYFVHKRWYGIFFTGLFIEVVYNAIISTIVIGWDVNMHYFILMMAYGVFFIPNLSRRKRLYTIGLAIIIYSLLYLNARDGVSSLPSSIEQILGLFCILSTLLLIAGLSLIFERAVFEVTNELEQTNDSLQTIASTDGLTGLMNRMTGNHRVSMAIAQAVEQNEPYAVILADIDRFKSFNEHHGHDCGDVVLHQVAQILSKLDGIAVRWGGEEFLLFLSGKNEQEVFQTVEHIRRQIESHAFSYDEEALHVTMTFGVSYRHDYETLDLVVKEADDRLRAGKRAGKNQVVFS